MADINLLKELCGLRGISGSERCVSDFIKERIKDSGAEFATDSSGNLLVFKKGKNRAKTKLLISAHMDEVGFIVTNITDDGYLKFCEVGGVDRRVIIGRRVLVGEKMISGVVGVKPVHHLIGDEKKTVPQISEFYIDIGAKTKDEALEYILPGDPVTFDTDFSYNSGMITSKAIDDRFGCMVLIGMINSELPFDMHFSFVVQEETGLRGAKTAAYTVDPDAAIVVEATTAADIPESCEAEYVCEAGKGAVISFMDKSTIYDKELYSLALETAQKNGIKSQVKSAVAGGNDSGAIHLSRKGVRTIAVSLPCRYLHSPYSVAFESDCDAVEALVLKLSEEIAGGDYK